MKVSTSDVKVPMRDGVLLHTRLYLPEGGPHPALLRRTPYPWEWMGADAFNEPNEAVARRGYALAVQYVRGRFSSEGEFEPFRDDVSDGFDSIDWLVEQDWCTGRVGMYGQSYEATVQAAALVSGHPALKCIVPQAFGASFVDGFPYASPGVFSLGSAIGWAFQVASENEAAAAEPTEPSPEDADVDDTDAGNAVYEMYKQAAKSGWHEGLGEFTTQFRDALIPLMSMRPGRDLEPMQTYAPWWRDWVDSHTASHPYWSDVSAADRDDLILPALHISGWFDQFLQATIDRYARWSSRAATPADRAAQRLIVGPWAHGLSSAQWDGHVDASPELEMFDHPDIESFHRRWLHDDHSSLDRDAPIKLFVIGDNVWRDEWEWPLARTSWTRLYLHSDGDAAGTGGTLDSSTPDVEAPDGYDYDPTDPVPAVGGAVIPGLVLPGPGPYDQREVEARPDVLTYTGQPLDQDLEVTGPVSVDLWAQTAAIDTDFTAKLVDVFPTGEAVFICQGLVRPRLLLGGDALDASATYHVKVDLTSTSYVFRAGHSVRLEISSSCFPVWDVNTNTGSHYFDDTTGATCVAHQQVFHDRKRPTHLTLPVIPRGPSAS